MLRFDEERQTLLGSIEKLNEKMKAMHLEHDDTKAQLEQLKELTLAQKEKVRNQRLLARLLWFVWPTAGASLYMCMNWYVLCDVIKMASLGHVIV